MPRMPITLLRNGSTHPASAASTSLSSGIAVAIAMSTHAHPTTPRSTTHLESLLRVNCLIYFPFLKPYFIFVSSIKAQRYYNYLEYASFWTKNIPFACRFIDFDRLRIVFLVFLSLDSNVFGTFSYLFSWRNLTEYLWWITDKSVVWEFTHKQMSWLLAIGCCKQLQIPCFPWNK